MSSLAPLQWSGERFVPIDHCDQTSRLLEVADSWLVSEGLALAIGMHRERFERGVLARGFREGDIRKLEVDGFWSTALAAIPPTGDWFPRVELVTTDGMPSLRFRLRPAPPLRTSVIVTTHDGPDPRTAPTIKGPNLASMIRLRTTAQQHGADEAILLTPDGYLAEGATTSLVWWRGNILCSPPDKFDRVDSVTARTLFGVAHALGVETHQEAVTPAELDGVEAWALNALHGIRIITRWLDGPELAEQPGRLALWRGRRERLRIPLDRPMGNHAGFKGSET